MAKKKMQEDLQDIANFKREIRFNSGLVWSLICDLTFPETNLRNSQVI